MHTDIYKIKLRSLSEGEHQYDWKLDDAYFKHLSEGALLGGEVYIDLDLERTGEVFSLRFFYEGSVTTTCDRCLEPVAIELEEERELIVKFGHDTEASTDEILIVSEQDGVLDLEWLLYEDVVLALPLQRVHPEGACDPEMMSRYADITTEAMPSPQDSESTPTLDSDGIDERWAVLKGLKKE